MCFSLLPSTAVEAVYAALLDCKLPEGIVQGKQGHANRAMCWDTYVFLLLFGGGGRV